MNASVSTAQLPAGHLAADTAERTLHLDEPAGSLEQRAADLRLASPAAYVALARHVDRLEHEGTPRDAALRRALRALGR